MPAIKPGSTILVTGASGFIGAHVARAFIEGGYTVIGTVRSPSKGDYLKKLFGDKFSYIIVEDMEKLDAFDEAVKGVDGIAHTASPAHLKISHPKDLIGPAVNGTVNVLQGALKNAPNVQRIVITASIACIVEPKDGPYTFTEHDWNTYSAALAEREGSNTPPIDSYRASKTLAERAAWKFVEDNKANIKWDIATIHPPLVYGPTIHEVSSPSSLNETALMFHQATSLPPTKKTPEEVLTQVGSFVDVRDIAVAHVRALEVEEAGGERFIVGNGPFVWQDFFRPDDDLAAAGIPDVPRGYPEQRKKDYVFPAVLDSSKAARVFGIKYHTRQETAVDAVKSVRERWPTAH